MKTPTLVVLTLLPLLALTACKRSAQPSPEFEQAQQKFVALYGRHLDSAFGEPEMTEVESLLESVPAESLDAEAAQALLTRIRDGRAAMASAAEERAQALAEAQAPAPDFRSDEPEVVEPKDPVEDAAPDAGVSQPTAGMPLAEFNQRFSGCFSRAPRVLVQGKGMRNTWELKNISNCRERHPGFDSQLVVEDGPLVLDVIQKSQVEFLYPDGGAQPPGSKTITR